MSQIDLQIGHKIKTKRRKLGISQLDLSKKLSISVLRRTNKSMVLATGFVLVSFIKSFNLFTNLFCPFFFKPTIGRKIKYFIFFLILKIIF